MNEDPDMKFGFSVNENKIAHVVQVGYYGLFQYMRSFLDSLSDAANVEINKTCMDIFRQSEKKSVFEAD
jgi:hypothetical protein